MIGRELQGDYYRTDFEATSQEEVALEGKNINYGDKLKNVNISLHKGEIVGIGGLSNCGMHYLGEALFGALELDGGQVITESGKEIKSCHNAVSQKI